MSEILVQKRRQSNKIVNNVRFWQNNEMFFLNYHPIWRQQKRSATAKCIPILCRQQKHKESLERNNNGRQEKVSIPFFRKKSVLFIIVVVVPFFCGYLAPNEKSLKRKKYNSFAFNASTISLLTEFRFVLLFLVRFFIIRTHTQTASTREYEKILLKIENKVIGCVRTKGQRVQKNGGESIFFCFILVMMNVRSSSFVIISVPKTTMAL